MRMQRAAPSEDLVAFARALRSLRRERELSQEALALMAGLHPKHVSDIERANKDPRLTTVVKLADALQVGIEELFPAHRRTPAVGGS
jgi:transcriptional regulator with XRE-family HTH domain